jgi:hypothetical protein
MREADTNAVTNAADGFEETLRYEKLSMLFKIPSVLTFA